MSIYFDPRENPTLWLEQLSWLQDVEEQRDLTEVIASRGGVEIYLTLGNIITTIWRRLGFSEMGGIRCQSTQMNLDFLVMNVRQITFLPTPPCPWEQANDWPTPSCLMELFLYKLSTSEHNEILNYHHYPLSQFIIIRTHSFQITKLIVYDLHAAVYKHQGDICACRTNLFSVLLRNEIIIVTQHKENENIIII
jgi:hypothetical protein